MCNLTHRCSMLRNQHKASTLVCAHLGETSNPALKRRATRRRDRAGAHLEGSARACNNRCERHERQHPWLLRGALTRLSAAIAHDSPPPPASNAHNACAEFREAAHPGVLESGRKPEARARERQVGRRRTAVRVLRSARADALAGARGCQVNSGSRTAPGRSEARELSLGVPRSGPLRGRALRGRGGGPFRKSRQARPRGWTDRRDGAACGVQKSQRAQRSTSAGTDARPRGLR